MKQTQKDIFKKKYLREKPVKAGMCVEEVEPNLFVNENGVAATYDPETDRFYQEDVPDYPMTAFQARQFFRETW